MSAQWTVPSGGQRQRPSWGPGDTPIDVMDVIFVVTETGDQGMITIPLNQYSPERVAELIQTRADDMLTVHRMGQSGA